ncbi:MAG: ATPase-like protein [Acidimicrobiales bacterium]|nr:ATPase-like protein [Acidimicrobiales bacterium]
MLERQVDGAGHCTGPAQPVELGALSLAAGHAITVSWSAVRSLARGCIAGMRRAVPRRFFRRLGTLAPVDVLLLGPMEVADDDGSPLRVQGAKLRALLAMLALECGRVVPTDRLIEELWHDDPPADVANALQGLISKLRRALGSADIVAMRPPGYVLVIDEEQVDLHRLDLGVAAARAAVASGDLEEAVARFADAESLWRGPALADFRYDDFAQAHVARLDEVHLSLVEDRLDAGLALGRHAQAISDLEALVHGNPLRERLRGQLMVALYRTGRQADALRVFQEGRGVLADDLGLDPGRDLQRLETAILNHDPMLLAADTETNGAAGTTRRCTNLKAALSPLIGRDRELVELADRLADHRLVTVVGPGGAGKTRLATEAARRLVDQRKHGVFMIELAPVGRPEAVADAVAAALELPESDVDALARVRQYCQGKDMLLVLDNCEHLVEAAARIAEELLGACVDLRILATSREGLRVTGEAVWPVPPLAGADAIELFVQRATSADPGFRVDDATRSVMHDICIRLDGLPLAIELAAARTRAFSVAQIAERLDDRFRLLTGGSRTAMARQQTLRAVVDWSYDLLFEDERRVFERLSVFTGGCLIGAAQTVCAGDDVDEADVEELIGGLVEKSLVLVDRSGPEPRYRTLQTLSQYGRERLVERGEADAVFGRMAANLAELCARSGDAFWGVEQRQWFMAVGAEQDNIRTAFTWAVGTEEKDLAVGIAADLALYRWVTGQAREGYHWLEAALALPGDVAPLTNGRALVWRAFLGYLVGHRDHVDEQFEEGLDLLREHAGPGFVAYVYSFYAQLVAEMGRLDKAAELTVVALEQIDAAPHEPWLTPGRTWMRAALAIQEHDLAAFEALLREAGQQFRDAGDHFMGAICLDLVAEFEERRGGWDDAAIALRHALDEVAGLRMAAFETALTTRLGVVALQVGDFPKAGPLLRDGLARAGDLSFEPIRALALNGLANLLRRQGRLDEAERAALEALALYGTASDRTLTSSFSRAAARSDVPVGEAASFSVLGFVAEARGDAPLAIEHHSAAYERACSVGHSRATPLALEGLAAAALLTGDGVGAARLLGCADRLRSEGQAARAPSEQVDVARVLDAAVTLLGRRAFAAANEQGHGSSPQDLVDVPVTT